MQSLTSLQLQIKQPMTQMTSSHLLNDLTPTLISCARFQDLELPEQVIPHDASLDDAIDVFDRVNSQGTKLSDAELALTHITGKWPHARRVMKQKIDECAVHNFHFGLTFMTRALTATVTGRALFETVHTRATSRAGERLD